MSISNDPRSSIYQKVSFDKISRSTAMQQFTFSKATRFPSLKLDHQNCGYSLPSGLSPKKSTFGVGDRKVFQGKRGSASPDTYKIPTVFNPDDPDQKKNQAYAARKKSFCFGAGRNMMKHITLKEHLKADPINPGPGNYNDDFDKFGTQGQRNSVHEKSFYFNKLVTAIKQNVPGPGSHENHLAIPSDGRYVSSMMPNSKAARINTGRRFFSPTQFDISKPGPAHYEAIGNLSQASQINTSYHNIKNTMLNTKGEHRASIIGRFKTPGPGTYRPPSDFGYLDRLNNTSGEKASRYNQNGSKMGGTSMMNDSRSGFPFSPIGPGMRTETSFMKVFDTVPIEERSSPRKIEGGLTIQMAGSEMTKVKRKKRKGAQSPDSKPPPMRSNSGGATSSQMKKVYRKNRSPRTRRESLKDTSIDGPHSPNYALRTALQDADMSVGHVTDHDFNSN